MKTRTPLALLVFALAVTSRQSLADSKESAADSKESVAHTEAVTIDFDALPKGAIPAAPTIDDAPLSVPKWSQLPSLRIAPVVDPPMGQRLHPKSHPRSKSSRGRAKKGSTRDDLTVVNITATSPTVDAFYLAGADPNENVSADTTANLVCGKTQGISALRWETLVTTSAGEARLDVRDVWFDGKTCAIGAGTTASVRLKAVAWDNGKPWLYAMRGENTVTFVLPPVERLSNDAMAGSTFALRGGGFTRVGIPIGRWGSASINANAPKLTWPAPGGVASSEPESGTSGAVEIGIDIVQTMSEKAPTFLVRVRHEEPAPDDAS